MKVKNTGAENAHIQNTDIHADDYALSPNATEDILKCIKAGRLDSISVLTNMSCYDEYAVRYLEESRTFEKHPLLSVHLNFMEGHCRAAKEKVPDLVDNRGFFNISWGKLFLWNYCPWRYRRIKEELKAEIKAQTEAYIQYFGKEAPLRFDGHQHTQMIPIVYRALYEVIREEAYSVEYIRVTKEPILPFLKKPSLWKTYRPVNWIKNLLLNFFALGMEGKLAEKITGQPRMFLWGVVLSGHMDEQRVGALLPSMKAHAAGKERTLEILFHPGISFDEEMGEEFISEGANEFYRSKGRQEEYQTVMTLKMQ